MKRLHYALSTRLAIGFLAGGLAIAGTAFASKKIAQQTGARKEINLPIDPTAISRETLPSGSYAPVVEKVAPAVVKLTTTTKPRRTSGAVPGNLDDPFWQRFFGEQFGRSLPHGPMGPQLRHGLGSGVIVTDDGYILTNNHVVDGADEVKVALNDGREFTAKVIGRDPKSDLAVIKIDATKLPTVTLSDSDNVQIGDVALAIGNPFGVGQTVTSGIVSATRRGGMGIEAYEDFIQTDAAINPGNSGGALVDIKGRLIGINTAIVSRTGGNHGIGFAIPSNLAKSVMESLIQDGRVTRGYLGVTIQNITPELAEAFDLNGTKGALVGGVLPDSPAATAGLQNGDVVVEFNGKTVTDSRRLQLEVAQTKPGATVPLEVIRNGEHKKLEVTVNALPGEGRMARADSPQSGAGTLDGVAVTDLDNRARTEFNVPNDVKGALVTQVEPGSAAAQAGLKAGDVLIEINRKPVANADDAIRLTAKTEGERTLLRVWQNGGSRYVVVDERDS